jgi:predicted nucleic acid-binding protein
MNGKPFFDTNVLIYTLVEGDSRSDTAQTLLLGGGVISVQVLNEFVAAAKGKLKMPWRDIREALADFLVFCPSPVSLGVEIHGRALDIAERYSYRFYDALVIAAAIHSGCSVLYSEDMQDGQQIESVTIRNPF